MEFTDKMLAMIQNLVSSELGLGFNMLVSITSVLQVQMALNDLAQACCNQQTVGSTLLHNTKNQANVVQTSCHGNTTFPLGA